MFNSLIITDWASPGRDKLSVLYSGYKRTEGSFNKNLYQSKMCSTHPQVDGLTQFKFTLF